MVTGLAALAYAGRLARRGDAEALIDGLKRPWLRSAAAAQLAQIKSSAAVPSLIGWLARSDATSRPDIAAALGTIGGPRAIAALRRALADADLDVEWSAHTALQRIGDEHAPPHSFARHEHELGETVRTAAAPEVAADAAMLRAKAADGPAPAIFELVPRNQKACAVNVQADTVQQVSLFIGPHHTWWEVWDDNRDALLAWVGSTVRGIMDGRYEEWVYLGEYRQAKGILHVPGGEDQTITNNILVRRWFDDFDHLTYEPYVARRR